MNYRIYDNYRIIIVRFIMREFRIIIGINMIFNSLEIYKFKNFENLFNAFYLEIKKKDRIFIQFIVTHYDYDLKLNMYIFINAD